MKHKLLLLSFLFAAFAPAASAQPMAGKTLWTLFDSLGDTNNWQPLLCRLTGMRFHPELNYHIMSYGGTSTAPSEPNGTLARAKLLVAASDSLPVDVVLIGNTNDINFVTADKGMEGSMHDKPWMQGRRTVVHKGALGSREEAEKYAAEHMDAILRSVPDSIRGAGAMLSLPYLNAGATGVRLTITATPRQSGTFYIITGRNKTGLFVTPEMTADDIISRLMEHSYGGGWTRVDNGDGSITFHYYLPEGQTVKVLPMNTGIETRLENVSESLEHILYFTGKSAKDWFKHSKWTTHISLYSAYKGLYDYLHKNLPHAQVYFLFTSYYNLDYSEPSLHNPDGSLNEAACRQTDRWKRWEKLKEFQQKVSRKCGVKVIDISESCGIGFCNLSQYYKPANPHPNQAAYELWAKAIAKYFNATSGK